MNVSLGLVFANFGLLVLLLGVKQATRFVGVYPLARRYVPLDAMFMTLLMSTGLTFGTISSLYGLRAGLIDQAQFSVPVTAVVLSAVIPTFIAQRWFEPPRGVQAVPPSRAQDPPVAGSLREDLQGPMGPVIRRYYQAARAEARERIKLFRLAWDMAVSAFGSRQMRSERFFFVNPARMARPRSSPTTGGRTWSGCGNSRSGQGGRFPPYPRKRRRCPVSEPLHPREFRRVMGPRATGVTVVTAAAGERTHATTANAVMWVSLDPLRVCVSVGRSARKDAFLEKAGGCALNILWEAQDDLSRSSAGMRQRPTPPDHRFVPWAGGPRLEGTLASVGRAVDRVVEVGDHRLFLGRVLALHRSDVPLRSLRFFAGACRRLPHPAARARDLLETWRPKVRSFYED